MTQFKKNFYLENQKFIVSKNVGGFPVQYINFTLHKSNGEVNGIFKGENIRSGKFIGKFNFNDQFELFFHWFCLLSSNVVTGKIFAFICEDTSGKTKMGSPHETVRKNSLTN